MNYNVNLLNNNNLLSSLINTANNLPKDPLTEIDNVTKAIVEGNIQYFSNSNISTLYPFTFLDCSNLLSVNLENCKEIDSRAFENCINLQNINIPLCETLQYSAFKNCISLQNIEMPLINSIESQAFYNCCNLTSINLPQCTYIPGQAFEQCSNLINININNCMEIGSCAFKGCTRLSTINIPKCELLSNNCFSGCYSLDIPSLNACTTIEAEAFRECRNLTSLNLPMCIELYGEFIFADCFKLSSIQLGAPLVCTLSARNIFASTPFGGYSSYFSGTPQIYVPQHLLNDYKSATNWAYFSSYFQAIPGSEPEINKSYIRFSVDGVEYFAEEGMTWREWLNSDYPHSDYNIIYDGYYVGYEGEYNDPEYPWTGWIQYIVSVNADEFDEGVYPDDVIENNTHHYLAFRG